MSKFIVNQNLQETRLGEGEGSVFFDPESENTHIVDDVALDIIELFRKGLSEDEVIDELSVMYDGSRDQIETDVKDFIKMALDSRILILQ